MMRPLWFSFFETFPLRDIFGKVRNTLHDYIDIVNDDILKSMNPDELIAARKELSLSPVEMARALGVDYRVWNQWETGRRKIPAVGVRCVELLLKYPRTAKSLSVK